MKGLFAVILIFSSVPVLAEPEPGTTYVLQIDEHEFEIQYMVNANVIAMAVDQELNSFLIGLEDANDSLMIIDLPHKLIRAEDSSFAVLVNGIEMDYGIESDVDRSKLIFFVPEFSEEVEIIGTHVIPEFPFGVLAVVAVSISAVLAITKAGQSLFRL